MFATVPVFIDNASETRIINLNHLEEIKPHADVAVGESMVASCEARFNSGQTSIILLDVATMQNRLSAIAGIVDEFGTLS